MVVFFFLYLFRWGKSSELPNAAVPLTVTLALMGVLMTQLIRMREEKEKSS